MPDNGVFATTHWSVVLTAGDGASPAAEAALERLCRTYWFPLYAHLRRRGRGPDDAAELTQELFARLLRRDAFLIPSKNIKFKTSRIASL